MKQMIAVTCMLLGASVPGAAQLEIRKGDHVCILGNALAERMQHHGWLETLLHSRFPGHELVVRNLAFPGDELVTRLRSANFGSPDDHLGMNKADVILAFFGYNESFAAEGGLEKFRLELKGLLEHMSSEKYNGLSAPRVVLFSPIAHENLGSTNLPDGSENNRRLGIYTRAMAQVAQTVGVAFVNLFDISLELYSRGEGPLTFNGVHLSEAGDKTLAPRIDGALFESPGPRRDAAYLDRLRAAVLDKNFYWFQRYRTTDGYSIHGGRADLKFVDGQTNRVVLEREMEILDAMTAHRDRLVWAVAQGKPWKVDDSNTPPFIAVKTNRAGKGPNGEHLFLGGEEAMARMQLHPKLKVNLFASEEQFPELANPVQIAFDTRGRLWVAVMPSYPHWKPKEEMNDKLLILEDTDGDGKADKSKVFADHLHVPTGFELWGGGVLVAQVPDLWFLRDTNGDDVADSMERVLNGLDSADTHHAANSFTLDPGGALYFQEGTFHHTQVESPWGPPERCANGGVFRYEPRTHKLDVYVTYGFANPHGHVFDRWGQDFVTDGTGNVNYYATAFSGRLDFPQKHSGLNPFFPQRTRPCPGTEILSSRHFPDEFQDNYLVANVIGFQGVLQYRMEEKDSGFTAVETEPLIFSSDPNFRPTDMEVGPDGALYLSDWQNPVIGHMQHNLRDPSRDRTHGRVYRITCPGRRLLEPARIAGEPIEKLLELLKEPEDRTRYRTRIELGARDTKQVIAAVCKWVERLTRDDPGYEHHLTEALWLHQSHNVVDEALLKRILGAKDYHARAAATRVLCYWRDRVADPIGLLEAQASDAHPRVRLEAVRAQSFFREARAAVAALTVIRHPMDYYLSYTLRETLLQLEPHWKRAIHEEKNFAAGNPDAISYLLSTVSTAELVKLPRTPHVHQAILSRDDIVHAHRHEALMGLAKVNGTELLTELLQAVRRLDRAEGEVSRRALNDLAHMLISESPSRLKKERDGIGAIASSARHTFTRQMSYLALATGDGSIGPAWEDASRSPSTLRDLLEAIPLLPDAALRASAHERIQPLVSGVPAEFKARWKGYEGLDLLVLDSGRNPALKREGNAAPGELASSEVVGDPESAIRRSAMKALVSTGKDEEGTFKILTKFVVAGDERAAAVRALSRIPQPRRPPSEARALIEVLSSHVKKLPAAERTQSEARDALQLADELAALLPAREGQAVRLALRALGVPVIVLRAVPNLMIYDRPQIHVEAGKAIEIVFENVDIMPHNLVVARPHSLEKVGLEGERMAADPNAFSRSFVPNVPEVLHATRLLQPGQSERLNFTAPTELGDYPYVCTFPGHWRRMNGVMRVVKSLDDVSPEALVAAASTPTGPVRPFVQAWTVGDLKDGLEHLGHGRNRERGKQLFTDLACGTCHRVNGVGGFVGPDLLQVKQKLSEKKTTPLDVLTEMIEPSKVIDEKFRSSVLVLVDGQLVSGIVIEETADAYKVRSSPLELKPQAAQKSDELRTISKADVQERVTSEVSLMPAGLLNTLSAEEILDLLDHVLNAGSR